MSDSIPVPETAPDFDVRLLATSARGDGRQNVLRFDAGGQSFILKTYGRKRGLVRTALRQCGHWLYARRSRVDSASRCSTEARLLDHWRVRGFSTPRVWPLEGLGDRPTLLLLECVEAPLAEEVLRGKTLTSEGARLVERLALELGRRHQCVIADGDVDLLHLHPGVQHVFVRGESLVWFDLELSSLSTRNLTGQVVRELRGWLHSLARTCLDRRALETFCAHYPHVDLLHAVDGSTSRRWIRRWSRSRGERRQRIADSVRDVIHTLPTGSETDAPS